MAEIFRNVSLFWMLFHDLILFMFLYRSRFDRTKTIVCTSACMGTLIVANIAGVAMFGAEQMGQLLLFSCTIPSLLYFWFMSAERNARFFFTFCLADTFIYWIMIITNLFDFFLTGGSCLLMLISRLIILPVTEFFVYKYLRKPYLDLQDNIKRGWGFATIMSAIYYLFLNVSVQFPTILTSRPEYIPAAILALLLMPLTYMTIFYALYQQMKTLRAQENDRLLTLQKKQLETTLENYKDAIMLRHNISAFRTTLSALLENGEYEAAQAFLSETTGGSDTAVSVYCQNPYVNAVLSRYVQLFSAVGTKLKVSITATDTELPGTGLSVILCNALDNALDAISGLPGESRRASIKLARKNDNLVMRVKNTCRPDLVVNRGTIPHTTKSGTGHGLGLTSIVSTAEKMGGSAVCYTENGTFVLDVHITIPQHSMSPRHS